MKVVILSTGNVEEVNESYARRLIDMGYAVAAKEKPAKAKVETADKLPEAAAEPEAEEKPAKGKKTK